MNADDEAIDRIRAADPARAQATDLASLRRAVDRHIESEASGPDDGDTMADGDELIRDELAARRAKRSRRRAWVAGIAASALVGTGGYLVGLTSGGAGGGDSAADSAEEAPAVSAADSGAELDSSGGGAGGAEMGPTEAQDGAEQYEDADTRLAWGRVVFVASGLPDETGSAEAFAYDATSTDPETTVTELAAALGIDGEAVEEGGGYWVVRGSDGRTVEADADGTASVGYSDPSLDPWVCTVEGSDAPAPDSGGDGGGTSSVGACPDETSAPADPVGTARDFLGTIGVDVADLRLDVESSGGGTATVSGYRSDAAGDTPTWNVTVADGGVYSAWGWLASVVPLGSYDTVSATTAVERLTDPRFGAGGIQPLAEDGLTVLDGDASVSSQPRVPDAPVEPGSDIPWPVTTYTISAAELGLGTYSLPDGSVVLLPTWSLTSEEGLTWSVVAVADDQLDFAAG